MQSLSLGQQGQTKVSSLLTFAIVSFTKFSVLPWMIHFLHAKKYESWAQVVVIYGFLATSLNFGVSLGNYMSSSHKELSNGWFLTLFLALTGSYTCIGLVSRLLVLFWLVFLVGFSGSLLSGYSLNLDKFSPTLKFHKKYSDGHYNANLERSIIAFIFATLLSSVIYDDRSKVDFPAYALSTALAVFSCFMMLYYIILALAVAKKLKMSGMSASSSSNANSTFSRSQNSSFNLDSIEVPYDGDVPLNFLSFCKGNIATARVMYGKTLAWRRKHDVDNIFNRPQRFFDEIVHYYPHAIHGFSLDGCQVVYEILGRGKPRELEATGITIDELVWHFNLRNELIFRTLCQKEFIQKQIEKSPPGAVSLTPFPYSSSISKEAMTHVLSTTPDDSDVKKGDKMYVPRMMTVIDVEGIGLRSITGQVLAFIQKSGEVIDNYFPEQVSRLVVVNAPWGFGSIFGMIAPALPAAVKKKVDILSSVQELSKYIHPSQRPVEYGGTDVPLGQWEGHKMFLALAEKWKHHGNTTNNSNADNAVPSQQMQQGVQRSVSGERGSSIGPVSISTNTPAMTRPPSNTSPIMSRQSSITSSTTTTNDSPNKSNAAAQKKTGGGWANGFGLFASSKDSVNKEKKKPVPEAFLGEQNQYQYNEATGLWELTKTRHQSRLLQLQQQQSHNQQLGVGEVDTEEEEELGYYSAEEDGPLNNTRPSDSNKGEERSGNGRDREKERERDSSGRPKRKDTMDEIEEHGMVLAIQASHIAKSIIRNNTNRQLSMSTSQLLPHRHYLGNNSMELGLSRGGSEDLNNSGLGADSSDGMQQFQQQPSSSSSNSSSNNNTPTSKLSSTIFLIVSLIFLLSTSIQNILISLLPLFLCSPLQSGGLGYGSRDLGLQLSFSGLVVLVLFHQLQGKCDHILRASPVRALRIACGVFCLCVIVLFAYIRSSTMIIEDILHHTHEGAHYGLEEHEHRTSIHHSLHHDGHVDPEYIVLSMLYTLLPSLSTLSMIVIGVLLACIMISAHVCRRAAGMLFHLVLSSVIQQPQSIRLALCGVLDTIAPLLYCSMSSLIYAAHLRFPLNSSFFLLPVTLSFALWIYIASIFLVIQFRGDYGVMSDHHSSSHYHSSEWKLFSRYYGGGKGGKKRGGDEREYQEHHGQGLVLRRGDLQQLDSNSGGGWIEHASDSAPLLVTNSADDQQQQQRSIDRNTNTGDFTGEDEHILTIPLGDINLLFSAGSNGYGSKLFNLKDDFKDV